MQPPTNSDQEWTSDDLGTTLPADYFDRPKEELARDLLGCDLVRDTDDGLRVGRIVETEAYGGPHDPASHADTGEATARTASMFAAPGTAYVYSIHAYYCLNVAVPAPEKAAAVLVRAAVPLAGHRGMVEDRGRFDPEEDDPWADDVVAELASGPGKLCEAFAIDRGFDGLRLPVDDLWIAEGTPIPDGRVETTPRIGLNPETVGEAVEWPWRWVVADSPFLSR